MTLVPITTRPVGGVVWQDLAATRAENVRLRKIIERQARLLVAQANELAQLRRTAQESSESP